MEYQTLIAIMERGKCGKALEVVNRAGARSGTLLKGRGSGLHEKQRILNVALEPEKDILMLVAPASKTEEIITNIDEQLKIQEPGNGIMLGMKVQRVHGI